MTAVVTDRGEGRDTAPSPAAHGSDQATVEVDGYRFGLTCPRCGGPLRHEAAGRPTDTGTRCTAIAKCTTPPCRTRWQVIAQITPFSYDPRKETP